MVTLAQFGQAAGAIKDIGSSIGSIGGLLGGLIGGNSSARAARDQYLYNLALQKQAQKWNEYMYKHRYQMQREDLELAGINPLYGFGSAPSVTSSQGSVGMPDRVGEMSSKRQAAIEMITLAQDWSAKQATIKNMEQKTKTEEQETQLKTYQAMTQQIETLIRKKDLDYYDKKTLQELEKGRTEILKNLADAGKANAEAGTARAKTKQINQEVNIKEPEEIIAKDQSKQLRKYDIIRGTATTTKNLEGIIKTALGIGGLGVAKKAATAQKMAKRGNSARKVIKNQ